MMNNQRKKIFGIFFFVCLIATGFCIRNAVWATIDTIGNTITGTNITTTNVASYDVNFQFSGTLDTGDLVTIEIIDSAATSISQTYTGIAGETGITLTFNASTLTGGIFTMSGSVADSGSVLLVGPITGEAMFDIEPPQFAGVTSGDIYTGSVIITFWDNNPGSTATLSGDAYLSGTPITATGNYIFIVTDAVGNSTGATFTINDPDTTGPTGYVTYDIATRTNTGVLATLTGLSEPVTITNNPDIYYTFTGDGTFTFTFQDSAGNTGEATATVNRIDKINPVIDSITSGQYFATGIIPTFTEINYSGATLNGSDYTSGTTIIIEGIYELIVMDLAGNTAAVTFTIDTTSPSATGSYVPSSLTNQDVVATLTGWNEAITGINFSNHTFTGNGSFTFTFEDLAGNTGEVITTVDRIDKTAVTGTVTYDTGGRTKGNVVAEITGFNKTGVTITSASSYTFTGNGTYQFTFTDAYGNTGSEIATVTWIDTTLPTVSTGIILAGNTGVNGTTGYYNGTISISSTVSDSGGSLLDSGSCEYTIDGTTRNAASYTSSSCYATGLAPATNISVRFRVQDIAGNLNTGGITNYIYDLTVPTTTDNATSTTGNVDVTVTLSPIDTGVGISGTLYCVDIGGTCTPTSVGTGVSVTGATNAITHKYVRYYSIDKLNNTGIIQTSLEINIDKETPVLTGTTTFSSNNGTNTGYAKVGDTITVFFQSHETLTGTPTLTISGGSLTTGIVTNIGGNNYSGSFVMKVTDVQGTIGFTVRMTDLVGNTGTISTTSTLIFDRTNPAGISITSPTSTSYFQGGTLKTITRSTGTEINFGSQALVLQYSNDGRSTLHSTISTGTANDGSYDRAFPLVDSTLASIRIIATDLAGNTATFTGNQFVMDSTAPTDVSILFPSGGEFLKGGSGYTITWSGGTDNFLLNKVIEYSAAGTFPGTNIYTDITNSFSYLWTTPAINSSGVKLRITVTDEGGLNKAGQTATFTIDSTAPTAIAFTDSNSNRRNISATATGTSTDALAGLRTTGVVYRTDTMFTNNCDGGSTTTPTFTTDGYWTGYACVMDKAGNVRTGQQLYKIDKTAPLVNMGTDKFTNTGTLINITVTGDIAGISGYVRSKVSGPGTITFSSATTEDPTVSADTDGTYVLQVIITDNANNVTTGTINFVRHTTAPVLVGAASVLNTTSQTPNYSFTGDEAGTISYSGSCSSATTTATVGSNTITFSALSNATYTGCKLRVSDSAGNASSWLSIPTFTVNYTAPSGGGGGGGGGGGIAICLDNQLACTNGKYVKKGGVFCAGGNLDKVCGLDVCVDGDYSGNPADGLCKDPTKVEASTGTSATSTGKWMTYVSPYSKELTDAYSYAFNAKITTVANINDAKMGGILIRSHLSKLMSVYAMEVLKQTPDTTRTCAFTDMQNQTTEFQNYAITACQLGLMGLKTDGTPATKFDPNGQVTRGIFGTTLSRALRGDKYNGGKNRYTNHLEALFVNKIIASKDHPSDREIRGYVMLMMQRADLYIIGSSYLKFTPLRGSKVFVPYKASPLTTASSEFSTAELDFINNSNKAFQFSEGYTAGQASVGVKYLQYFLKAKKYYTSTINGINTTATMEALFQFQFDNNIVTDEKGVGAGYLGPTTREKINPLLKALLNP